MTSQPSARTMPETAQEQTGRSHLGPWAPFRSERGIRRSLRGKILVRALAIALIPLLVIGAITLGSLVGLSRRADQTLESERQQLGNEVAGQRLRTEARAIAQELDGFLHERVSDVTGWASNPTITEAAIAAAQESQPYAATSNEVLEAEFADSRQIGTTSLVRRFLIHQLEREPAFSSIFFTERNGFNVTSTGDASDFVQRDNEWWLSTQIRGLHFGAIEYDAGAEEYSLPLSARVKNPTTGEGFGGVLQARLGVDLLQQVARRNAGPEGRQVTILTGDGRLLVETGSEQESRRIMQRVTFEEERQHAVDTALAASQPGFVVRDDIIVGYAPLLSVRDRPGGTATDIDAFLGIDANPINWVVLVEQPTEAAFAELNGLTIVREGLNTTATQLAAFGLVALILAVVAATMVSTRLSSRIVQPLLSLRGAAYDISERQLPELVDYVQRAEGDDEDLPVVPAVKVETDDEVEDVADAFNVVRDTAVDLAAEQARSRRNASTMFVNLGRRNQNLLSKQLEFIDELERDESDTRLREILFRLDHLATRMRRNAESLLVLAGEESPRRWTEPILLSDVLQDAISEVEEYQRVDVHSVDDVRIVGQAASDIAHLLAELIENATNFSPPDSPVTVVGWWVAEGYAISIIDDGIGMTEEELQLANERLFSSPSLHRVPSSYLGLFVIGHLAARYGIRVRLVESAADGVAAKVFLPHDLLAERSGSAEPLAAGGGAANDQRDPDEGAYLSAYAGASHIQTDDDLPHRRNARRHDDDAASGLAQHPRVTSPGVTVPPVGDARITGGLDPTWSSSRRDPVDGDAAELEARRARERLGRYQRAVKDGQEAVSARRHDDHETRERS